MTVPQWCLNPFLRVCVWLSGSGFTPGRPYQSTQLWVITNCWRQHDGVKVGVRRNWSSYCSILRLSKHFPLRTCPQRTLGYGNSFTLMFMLDNKTATHYVTPLNIHDFIDIFLLMTQQNRTIITYSHTTFT